RAGASVSFDASGSTHPSGVSAGYIWAFGDGGAGSGPIVSHSYARAGSYAVTLIVVDSDGQTATSIEHITVSPRQLSAHVSIPRGQGVAAIRKHGLVLSVFTSQRASAAVSIRARFRPTRAGVKTTSRTLLRGRVVALSRGRHRLVLK